MFNHQTKNGHFKTFDLYEKKYGGANVIALL